MKRELAAAALLAALIAASVLNMAHADRLTALILLDLTRAENAAMAGDYDTALADYRSALELWQGARTYTGIFLRHPDVDAASDAFFDLQATLQGKDAQAFPAAFAKLRYHLFAIDELEHPGPGAIF